MDNNSLRVPTVMKGHDILLKYLSEKSYFEQLKYGGLFMRTPKYYREHGGINMSVGDPNELDDLYPIWCASILKYQEDIERHWEIDVINNCFIADIRLSEKASLDVYKSLTGVVQNQTSFEPLGDYVAVIFNAGRYIGNLVGGFTDASFYFVDRVVRAIPIECGPVSYGVVDNNHPKLYKADERFNYQREYRIRLGIAVSPSKYDVALNLSSNKIFEKEFEEIELYDKDSIIDDYERNGVISFKHIYRDFYEQLVNC